MKTILLTGANGYLGSYLARDFLAKRYRIAILKRSTSNTRRIDDILGEVRVFETDRSDETVPFRELDKIDVVVHTATCYGRSGESDGEIVETNIAFPLRLLNLAIQHGVRCFVNTDTALHKETNAYGLSKAHFAEWGRQTVKNSDIVFINTKVEHFYGPHDDSSKFTTHVIRSCMNNVPALKLTLGEQQRDFIFIEDVVSAYNALLTRSAGFNSGFHEYAVGSGEVIRIREFVETVHRLTRSHTRLEFGAVPYRVDETMCSQADTTRMRTLGWMPRVGLMDGLEQTIEAERTAL